MATFSSYSDGYTHKLHALIFIIHMACQRSICLCGLKTCKYSQLPWDHNAFSPKVYLYFQSLKLLSLIQSLIPLMKIYTFRSDFQSLQLSFFGGCDSYLWWQNYLPQNTWLETKSISLLSHGFVNQNFGRFTRVLFLYLTFTGILSGIQLDSSGRPMALSHAWH